MAATTANGVRDLLLSDQTDKQAEFILSLSADAAEGRELPPVITDVIQVGLACDNGAVCWEFCLDS